MVWLFVFISVGSVQYAPCIWLLVCRLHGKTLLTCFVNSPKLSFSWWLQYTSSFLGWYIRWFLERSYAVFNNFGFFPLLSELWSPYTLSSPTYSFLCIDQYFCSSSVVLDFTWSHLSSSLGSDHYPILLSEVHSSPLLLVTLVIS